MAAAAGVASIASMGLSAYSSVAKGSATQAADDAQAAKLEQAAQYGKIQADQTATQYSENLNTTLGNIDVMRAAAGVDPTSPTTQAIEDKQTFLSNRASKSSVDNILQQGRQNEADANYLRQAGDFAVTQSYVGAAASIAGSAAQGYKNGTFTLGS